MSSKLNILLAGETGVGKSTFINSMFNYAKFRTLDEAMAGELEVKIPLEFCIIDESTEDTNGPPHLEVCSKYTLEFNGNTLELINTPGIEVGKTRMETSILEHTIKSIENCDKLDAILFFLKLDDPRMKDVLNKLKLLCQYFHRSASKSVHFVFTNSRNLLNLQDDLLEPLKGILSVIKETLPHVDVPCTKDNVYCVDNEPFRFLDAFGKGSEFSEQEIRDFQASWDMSAAECRRLVETVSTPASHPHRVKDTLDVNEAWKTIANFQDNLFKYCVDIDQKSQFDRQKIENECANVAACATFLESNAIFFDGDQLQGKIETFLEMGGNPANPDKARNDQRVDFLKDLLKLYQRKKAKLRQRDNKPLAVIQRIRSLIKTQSELPAPDHLSQTSSIKDVASMTTEDQTDTAAQPKMSETNDSRKPEVRIVILGDSGAGKSTFINSIANYSKWDSLKSAKMSTEEIRYLLPFNFTIMDEDYNTHEVKFGNQQEQTSATSSSNSNNRIKCCSEIQLKLDESNVRILMPPSIDSACKEDKSLLTIEAITQSLTHYEYINAIILMMKSTDLDLSNQTKLVIRELLSRMHQNSGKNLVFMFTNVSGTAYMPSHEFLKKIQDFLKDVQNNSNNPVRLRRETVYNFDNEGFRHLAASSQGVPTAKAEEHKSGISWGHSATEWKRFLAYVQSPDVVPHRVLDFMAIHQAQQWLADLPGRLLPLFNIWKALAVPANPESANIKVLNARGPLQIAAALGEFVRNNALLASQDKFEQGLHQMMSSDKLADSFKRSLIEQYKNDKMALSKDNGLHNLKSVEVFSKIRDADRELDSWLKQFSEIIVKGIHDKRKWH